MKKIERIAAPEQRVAALEAKLGVVKDEPVNGTKLTLAVGQVWKMRNGQKVTITSENMGCLRSVRPWFGKIDGGAEGLFRDNVRQERLDKNGEYDLVELICDAHVPEQKVQVDTSVALPEPYTTPNYWLP